MRSRRDFIKLSAMGLGAVGACAPGLPALPRPAVNHASNSGAEQASSEIKVWVTNGRQRFAPASPIRWQPTNATDATNAIDTIQLVPANRFQEILRFGACFTDASCYLINQLHESTR